MFILKDLMGDAVKGRYYKEQLRKAPTPGEDFNFEVTKCALYFLCLLDAKILAMKNVSSL